MLSNKVLILAVSYQKTLYTAYKKRTKNGWIQYKKRKWPWILIRGFKFSYGKVLHTRTKSFIYLSCWNTQLASASCEAVRCTMAVCGISSLVASECVQLFYDSGLLLIVVWKVETVCYWMNEPDGTKCTSALMQYLVFNFGYHFRSVTTVLSR
jgi:hypothetical protein